MTRSDTFGDAERVITPELEPGEKLLWCGRPVARLAVTNSAGGWVVGVLSVAFVFFWGVGFFLKGASPIDFSKVHPTVPLFGAPLLLVGLLGMVAQVWAYQSARRTAHAVTNRRVLTVSGSSIRKVTTYLPRDLTGMERKERADGSGDLLFGRRDWRDAEGDLRSGEAGLYGIPDVRKVEKLIREELLLPSRQAGQAVTGERQGGIP